VRFWLILFFGLTFALEFLSLKMDEFTDWGKDAGFSGRTWRQVEVRRDLNISHNLFYTENR
jgi:hypothetical protein